MGRKRRGRVDHACDALLSTEAASVLALLFKKVQEASTKQRGSAAVAAGLAVGCVRCGFEAGRVLAWVESAGSARPRLDRCFRFRIGVKIVL